MRAFVCLALSAGLLIATASAHAHPLSVRPKVVPHLEFKTSCIVLQSGQVLPSMPEMPVCTPAVIDHQGLEEHQPKWPREAVKSELEYDATPLLAPPGSVYEA